MESPSTRPCPSCSAPTQARQRWCLECGAEVGVPARTGLRPLAGLAAALALLVGAGSAGGYTLLQDGKDPPPPPTTVAQAPPPTATLPPATQEPPTYVPPPATTTYPRYTTPSGSTGGTSSLTAGGGSTTPSGTSNNPAGGAGTGGSSHRHEDGDPDPQGSGGAHEPQLTLTDIALGAVAIPYAPYAPPDADLGDASRVVDGTVRTAWRTPAFEDPAAHPQMGVYVDLASRERIRRLVVRTSTPGIDIEVYGARGGPPATIVEDGWEHLANRADIGARTAIKLPKRPFRYILVWIVGLPPEGGRAALSELSLISLQPE
jgi:hypothetical protein